MAFPRPAHAVLSPCPHRLASDPITSSQFSPKLSLSREKTPSFSCSTLADLISKLD